MSRVLLVFVIVYNPGTGSLQATTWGINKDCRGHLRHENIVSIFYLLRWLDVDFVDTLREIWKVPVERKTRKRIREGEAGEKVKSKRHLVGHRRYL